jgi:hypothetical protein
MRLYALSLIAQRTKDGQTEIAFHPLLIIQDTEELAQEEAGRTTVTIFPPSDGWGEYKIISMEIEQGMEFDDGKRLTWHIEETAQTTETPHGEN